MATQKQRILQMLEFRGFKGISVYELVYQHGITRAAAVIHELRNEGIEIDTIDEGDDKLCRYVLHKSNLAPVPPCACGHIKRRHLSNVGKCMDMLNPDDVLAQPGYCECISYRAALAVGEAS